jgi:hypothetical protein
LIAQVFCQPIYSSSLAWLCIPFFIPVPARPHFWNPPVTTDYFGFRGTHVGIKSFQGKINLFRNPPESEIPAKIPEERILEVLHSMPHVTIIQLAEKQVSAMAFCLLLLPHPAASRYTVLPPLQLLLDQRQQWRSWCGGLW